MAESDFDEIKRKIERGGEPLESRIAGLLKKERCRVITHERYRDAEEGKSRESDILALCQLKTGDEFEFNIHFCVECKSTGRTWVFLHDGNESPTTVENKIMWKGTTLKVSQETRIRMDTSADRSIYEGYDGMRATGRRRSYPRPIDLCGSYKVLSKPDDIFEAANQAVKASLFRLENETKKLTTGKQGYVSLVVPVIASDNPVLIADISTGKTGDVRPIEDDEVVWYIFKYLDIKDRQTNYTIPVVTPKSAGELVDRIRFNCRSFCLEYFGIDLWNASIH